MDFDLTKKVILAKEDKSKKGSIDEQIKPLIDKINALPDYFTTSSCSGRILLITAPKDSKKYGAKWLFISHGPVLFEELSRALKTAAEFPVWFRQESAILHICCRTIEAAHKLLQFVRGCGFRRAGIISLSPKIICEVIGAEALSTIAANNSFTVSDSYLKLLIGEANNKMALNQKRISRLCRLLN